MNEIFSFKLSNCHSGIVSYDPILGTYKITLADENITFLSVNKIEQIFDYIDCGCFLFEVNRAFGQTMVYCSEQYDEETENFYFLFQVFIDSLMVYQTDNFISLIEYLE